ncbi:hypothetical protein [Pseudoalteromonas luteoviolacea]|uniref:hypothetical protein n=1 Tax=Pseudoalteromonas luteoviolacea TaxID=43657 RepID=UPI000ABF31CC|nr:hypothetical protein [Pseudoalteromonas luteoviolacea]
MATTKYKTLLHDACWVAFDKRLNKVICHYTWGYFDIPLRFSLIRYNQIATTKHNAKNSEYIYRATIDQIDKSKSICNQAQSLTGIRR